MKIAAVFFLVSALTAPLTCSASEPTFLLASPDRPSVWYNRAGDKVSQNLEWSRSRHELAARVAYDRVQFVPLRDQTYYDTFRLKFPSVRLDGATQRLFFVDRQGRENEFGSVQPGPFGDRVVLDRGVGFAVFRDGGVVHAAIGRGISPSSGG